MSSREKILKEIAQNKPSPVPLPLPFVGSNNMETGLLEKLVQVLHSIGGKGILVDDLNEVQNFLQQQIAEGVEVVNCIPGLHPFNSQGYIEKEAKELEGVHTVILQGKSAIAENAAIWVTESAMLHRALPFICQQLVIVIHEEDIVADMHSAYAKNTIDQDGYGVFIAGPSKTADIEQSLVIGAHGPLSLQVFILKEKSAL